MSLSSVAVGERLALSRLGLGLTAWREEMGDEHGIKHEDTGKVMTAATAVADMRMAEVE